jgi:hypothetical protein
MQKISNWIQLPNVSRTHPTYGDKLQKRSEIGCRKDTAKLFQFAMEKSGSGPPRGIMSVNDARGAIAFIRAVKNQLSLEHTFSPDVDTISEYATINKVPEQLDKRKESRDKTYDKKITVEQGIQICKADVSPALLFLHLDQGCYEDTGYTPFASVIGNSRSIDPYHVKEIEKKVDDSKGQITQEDISIIPFEVCLNGQNDQPEANQPEAISYRCILNRDRQSNITVMGKKALPISFEALEALNLTVSF